jgi:molybdopterin-guanine dinucleotide biosynthesis protein B
LKVIGIVGYKKSGKTTLGVRLVQELEKMGHRVGVVKHIHCALALPDTDTAKYREHADVVAAISPDEAEIVIRGRSRVADMLKYMDADIVLVEGFKEEKTYPKIVCLRDKDEEKELTDEMTLCTAGFEKGLSEFDIMNDSHVKEMARLASEKVLKLP